MSEATPPVCDYAGLANEWLIANGYPDLGTSFSGSVTERSLSDGRILVRVELHTTNAFTFGTRITAPPFGDQATDPLIFGARPQDVLTGATPGIGECHASFCLEAGSRSLARLRPRLYFRRSGLRTGGPLASCNGDRPAHGHRRNSGWTEPRVICSSRRPASSARPSRAPRPTPVRPSTSRSALSATSSPCHRRITVEALAPDRSSGR